MAHFSTYSLTPDNAQSSIDLAERERAHHEATKHTGTPPTVHTKSNLQLDIAGDGTQTLRDNGAHQVALEPSVRPGNVIIPGFGETSIEAAKAAGLLPAGFSETVGGQQPAPAVEQAKQEAPKQELAKGNTDATDAAEKVITDIAGKIGGEAVETSIWQAAETGDYEANLPAGVEASHVASIVEGFTTQANNILKAASAGSVDILNEVLSDAELREARMATINNDAHKLVHFGKLAMSRMETLPYDNADAFNELLADMPEAERKALSFDKASGQWTVRVPGRDKMSFGQALRAGVVRIG